MSETIAKVARALAASRGVEILDDVDQQLFERDARAAILAMREPTDEMLEALQTIARWAKQPDTTLDAIYHLATVTLESAEAR